MKLWQKILVGVAILVVGGIGVVGFLNRNKLVKVDPNNLPQFIQSDFVDLSKIYSISKFRSGEGHDFSSTGETCRSMKHYFNQQFDPTDQVSKDPATGKGIPPSPDGVHDVDILSPVDGTVQEIATETFPIGKQIYIVPDSHKEFVIRLFHVYPVDALQSGRRVAAGEKIGVIAKGQGTDIAVSYGIKNNFVSYFQVMPDSIFASYQARGVTSRDDVIVSKEYRDAHPFQCRGEEFVHSQEYTQNNEDDVHLSGYVAPTYNQGNMNNSSQSQQDGNDQYGNYPTGGSSNDSYNNNSNNSSY